MKKCFPIIVLLLASELLSVSILKGQAAYVANSNEYDIIADSTGIRTNQFRFNQSQLFPKATWEGSWIWLNKDIFSNYQSTEAEWIKVPSYRKQYRALFRKSLHLVNKPASAYLSLTADISFRLYVNGDFIHQGPADIGSDYLDTVPPGHWFYSVYDISKYLGPGLNTIAVEVFSHYNEISQTTSGNGKMICNLDTALNSTILFSDTSWKCNIDTSITSLKGGWLVDNRLALTGWADNDYDDSLWPASSLKESRGEKYLQQSRIPLPFRHRVSPEYIIEPGNTEVSVENSIATSRKTGRNGSEIILDFGKNMTAFYGFSISADENDTILVFPSEKLNASLNRPLTFVCRQGLNEFRSPSLCVFRYLKIRKSGKNDIDANDIWTEFSSYPVNYTGSFFCSDTSLVRIWDIARWSLQLCMNDMFYDSPKHQEPIACTGDYLIESLMNYYAFGDKWLTRQTLLKTALMLGKNNYDMFHTSYSLLWVQMLNHYFKYTGDTLLVKELLPHVNLLNNLFETYLDSDFLVSNAPDYMFMDWIKIDKFNAHHPPAVIGMGYMTAFYYKSLTDAAYLNSLINDRETAEKALLLAGKIRASFNKVLWDEKKGLYRDGLPFRNKSPNHYFFPPDEDITTYSPHVNTLSVLYDIADKKKQSSIMKYVLEQKDTDLQPYFMFFVLSAIDNTGRFGNEGLDLLKRWEKGIDSESYTLKENWQDRTETGYSGDYSHAWGGSPLYFMSKTILGVKPFQTGYKVIEICPFVSESLKWAEGKIPLSETESISVSWSGGPNSDYIYRIEIPEGRTVRFIHPAQFSEFRCMINNKKQSDITDSIELPQGSWIIKYIKR